jgi:3-hydroxyacyl-CoA dehydrogenase
MSRSRTSRIRGSPTVSASSAASGRRPEAAGTATSPGRRDAIVDPAVDALIAGYRSEIGVAPRAIDDGEIVGRCILALVNEGARILEEGIALRASDIDVRTWRVTASPVPRRPDVLRRPAGLPDVMTSMQRFAAAPRADVAFWQPAPLLQRLAAEGRSLAG